MNIGTAGLENPDWTASVIKQYGDRVAVGLDVRGHTLAARGWVKEGGDLFETRSSSTPSDAPVTSSPMWHGTA